MRKCLALLTLVVSMPGLVFAGDHVVARGAVDARLQGAAASRAADLTTLHRFLATPQAERAAALRSDPVAGLAAT